MPAWHFFLLLQTSLIALPSVTPHPMAATKFPLELNFWIRAFSLSAT
jgi:hypothetical protein